jgi:hypothetical protein
LLVQQLLELEQQRQKQPLELQQLQGQQQLEQQLAQEPVREQLPFHHKQTGTKLTKQQLERIISFYFLKLTIKN